MTTKRGPLIPNCLYKSNITLLVADIIVIIDKNVMCTEGRGVGLSLTIDYLGWVGGHQTNNGSLFLQGNFWPLGYIWLNCDTLLQSYLLTLDY